MIIKYRGNKFTHDFDKFVREDDGFLVHSGSNFFKKLEQKIEERKSSCFLFSICTETCRNCELKGMKFSEI